MRNYDETRALVTGGAGFLGSHLCERLLDQGAHVTCLDNLFTGRKQNIEHLLGNPRFDFLQHDVTNPIYVPADDPQQRRPDISLAQAELSWQPTVQLDPGLMATIAYFSELLRLPSARMQAHISEVAFGGRQASQGV